MNKVRLFFKGVSEIVGGIDLSLIVLTDVSETRQLTIVCDKQTEYQFSLRLSKVPVTGLLLPEVLGRLLKQHTGLPYEILIHDIVDGQYRTTLINTETMDMTPIRVSDAILFSYIEQVPLYIEERLMMRQSVPFNEHASGMAIPVNAISKEMLLQALEKAIEEENYELASHLRDELNHRSGDSTQE